MAITSIKSNALQGIARGLQGLHRSAAEIASLRANNKLPTRDEARALVELQQHLPPTTASIKTLSAADRMIGSLLDIKV
ncbi:MAG: hypothetical protein KDI83_10415 [Gammaproteobacteria bacterium]|nr:hypothetical protein [Gammaproteobacteria bacterium]